MPRMIDGAALASLVCSGGVRDLVREVVVGIDRLLQDALVGVHLHGSLAMGCFTEKASDIDLLVVTDGAVPKAVLGDIVELMLRLSERAPAKGFEMSVVDAETTNPFVHPAPFLLHYSNALRDEFRSGTVDLDERRTDPDLAAHFCRVAGYLHDGAIRSKPEGGEWALERFGDEARQVIAEALTEYRRPGSSGPVPAEAVVHLALALGSLMPL